MPQESRTRSGNNQTQIKRQSDRELVVTRTFDAPVQVVFEAWRRPELFQRWWIPSSAGLTLISCEMEVRTGGRYRLEFGHPLSDQPIAFFGTYLEVVPNQRIVWTNEESDQGAVTTVSFAENNNQTQVTLHERYPTSAALEEAIAGSAEALPEQFAQLAELLADQPGQR